MEDYILRNINKREAFFVLKIVYTFFVVALLIGIVVVAFVMKERFHLFSIGIA